MIVRDSKRRTALTKAGDKVAFNLRRLYCPNCGKLHLEIPDCLIPYKRYFKLVIDGVASGIIDYAAIDDSTIRRWKSDKHT